MEGVDDNVAARISDEQYAELAPALELIRLGAAGSSGTRTPLSVDPDGVPLPSAGEEIVSRWIGVCWMMMDVDGSSQGTSLSLAEPVERGAFRLAVSDRRIIATLNVATTPRWGVVQSDPDDGSPGSVLGITWPFERILSVNIPAEKKRFRTREFKSVMFQGAFPTPALLFVNDALIPMDTNWEGDESLYGADFSSAFLALGLSVSTAIAEFRLAHGMGDRAALEEIRDTVLLEDDDGGAYAFFVDGGKSQFGVFPDDPEAVSTLPVAAPGLASAPAPAPEATDRAASPTPPSKRFCTSCGESVGPDAAFCTSCGTSLPSRADSPEAPVGGVPPVVPAQADQSVSNAPPSPGMGTRNRPSAPAGTAWTSSTPRWVPPIAVVAGVLLVGVVGLLALGAFDDEPEKFDSVGTAIETPADVGGSSSDTIETIGVSVSDPRPGEVLAVGEVTVSASVTDSVVNYTLEVDGTPVSQSGGPWLTWDAEPGRHTLVVEVESPEGSVSRSDPIEVTVEEDESGAEPIDGEWIVSLGSYPGDHPQDRLASALDDIRAIAPDARMMRTDEWPSLTPDYWVLYIGPFDTAADTWDACHDLGLRNSSDCFGAPISSDPDDHSVRIYPQAERP